MRTKRERRIAVHAVLCSGHLLVVVFRGNAGIEHVIVSERTGEDPENILLRRMLLEEIRAIVPLERASREYAAFTASLKDELDKLICREGVYRAR